MHHIIRSHSTKIEAKPTLPQTVNHFDRYMGFWIKALIAKPQREIEFLSTKGPMQRAHSDA